MTAARASVAIGVIVVALAMGACGSGGAGASSGGGDMAGPNPRPSSPAQLQIVTPTNGQVVHGPTVSLKIKLTGATIVPAMSMRMSPMHISPTKGHIHVSLDGKLVSMNYGLSQPLHKVAAGTHTLHVEFVASDHQPFDPPVFQEIAFTVKK